MPTFKAKILDSAGVSRALKRISHEIIERNDGVGNICLIGIRRRGVPLARMIAENPDYGEIICRCETVTEGEILAAIRRPLGATTLDGVKRRTRAGMGRCQAGFCTPKIMAIMERELGMEPEHVSKCGPGSELLVSEGGELAW